MIKLSTKGRYATRLMLNLAQHYSFNNRPIILKDVSKEEEISLRYLEQIIIPLRINKLLKSVRGAGGGYLLTKPPSEIKLIEIIESLEEPICLVDCIFDRNYCPRTPICAAHEVWKEATFLLRDYFKKITLQDIVEISKKKNPNANK